MTKVLLITINSYLLYCSFVFFLFFYLFFILYLFFDSLFMSSRPMTQSVPSSARWRRVFCDKMLSVETNIVSVEEDDFWAKFWGKQYDCIAVLCLDGGDTLQASTSKPTLSGVFWKLNPQGRTRFFFVNLLRPPSCSRTLTTTRFFSVLSLFSPRRRRR